MHLRERKPTTCRARSINAKDNRGVSQLRDIGHAINRQTEYPKKANHTTRETK